MRKPNYHLPREAPVMFAPLTCRGSDLAPRPALIDGCYGVKVSDGWYRGAEHFHIVGFANTDTEVRPPREKDFDFRGLLLSAVCSLAVLGAVVSFFSPAAVAAGPVTPHPVTATRHSSPEETDRWYAAAGHSVIQRSDVPFTLTFDACRENEKHHVSCQFKDPSGDSHWVYLPGVSFPLPKK